MTTASTGLPQDGAHRWQRVENLLIAIAIVLALIASGHPWWLLLAAFLIFDLSALGYLATERVGALSYNLVHNYAPPAALLTVWAALLLGGIRMEWMAVLAACWGFHVAVDRALGYGLKIGPFSHTHLGIIGSRPRGTLQRGNPRNTDKPHLHSPALHADVGPLARREPR